MLQVARRDDFRTIFESQDLAGGLINLEGGEGFPVMDGFEGLRTIWTCGCFVEGQPVGIIVLCLLVFIFKLSLRNNTFASPG